MNTVLHIDSEKSWRGGQQQILYLIKGLYDFRNLVACPPESKLEEEAKKTGKEVFPVRMRGEWDMSAVYKLVNIIRRHSVAIVHLHSPHAHTLGLVAAKIEGSPKVILSRRVDFPIGRNIFSRLKYRSVDRVIAISERVKRVLENRGVDGGKIDIVYSGIDIERFSGVNGKYLISELRLENYKFRVGNISALAWHKDQKTLIRSARLVVDEIPGVVFLIVGEGPLRQDLEQLIRAENLEENVKLVGFRKDIPEIMSILDLFVLSSSWEALGTSILDALASRVPVVATNVGGIPEIINDGINGILVPPQNPEALAKAIISLLKDKEKAARLRAEGYRLVKEKFAVERMVEQTRKVYERVLQLRGKK